MALSPITKHPAERFAVAVDFSGALKAGDSVSSGDAVASVLTIDEIATSGSRVQARIAGGSVGLGDVVTFTATTASGEVLVAELPVRVAKEVAP